MDKRIGMYNEDGSVASYPDTDVAGGSYEHPPSTRGIDSKHFVVITGTPQDEIHIAEICEYLKPKPTKRGKNDTDAVETGV